MSVLRRALKSIISPFYKTFVEFYLKKNRNYTYKGIQIQVNKGVFHPGLFFSTRVLLHYLEHFSLEGKKFMELGAGTGLIAVCAAKRGALVTATDISSLAVENSRQNAQINNVSVEVIHADLFEKIDPAPFDFILINPPYYKKQPVTEAEYAWFCGENSEYFKKLFKGLPFYIHPQSKIIMVLSEACNIDEINGIAAHNNFKMHLMKQVNRLIEMNYVYEFSMIL
jgi:release factor glutamine methyltransferase